MAILACVVFAVALAVYIGSRADNGFRAIALVIACASGFFIGVLVGAVGSRRETQRQRQADLERARVANRLYSWGPVVSITGLIESGEEDMTKQAHN